MGECILMSHAWKMMEFHLSFLDTVIRLMCVFSIMREMRVEPLLFHIEKTQRVHSELHLELCKLCAKTVFKIKSANS